MLEKTPELRLGSSVKGAKEIRQHEFFSGFSWDAVVCRQLEPPWKPDMVAMQARWKSPHDDAAGSSSTQSLATEPEQSGSATEAGATADGPEEFDPKWDADF